MESENDSLASLLAKVEILRLKYSARSSDDAFNIFSILRKESDEVNLHSNFIATLLNAKGSHGKGQAFLEKFISCVSDAHTSGNITYDELGECLAVRKEYRNIDLYVEFEYALFVVENKIYAEDQYCQLERYYESMLSKNKKIYLVYLSLYGRDPPQESLGELSVDDVITISYSSEILGWIDLCIKEAAMHPTLRETLVQYLNLIKKLTGQSMHVKYMNEIIELLSKHDNAKNALEIWKCKNTARHLAQTYFWNELEYQIVNHDTFPYGSLKVENYSYSKSFIKSYVSKKKKRKIHYGVFFKLKELDEEIDLCLYIEIGRYDNLYYGLGLVRNSDERVCREEGEFLELVNPLIVSNLFLSNGWWLTNCRPIALNFYKFNNENTVSMLNSEFRKEFVRQLATEIYSFIDEVTTSEISCEVD